MSGDSSGSYCGKCGESIVCVYILLTSLPLEKFVRMARRIKFIQWWISVYCEENGKLNFTALCEEYYHTLFLYWKSNSVILYRVAREECDAGYHNLISSGWCSFYGWNFTVQ